MINADLHPWFKEHKAVKLVCIQSIDKAPIGAIWDFTYTKKGGEQVTLWVLRTGDTGKWLEDAIAHRDYSFFMTKEEAIGWRTLRGIEEAKFKKKRFRR